MTKIEWTNEVYNPVRGCKKVSSGCANCYAEKMAARFSGPSQPYEGLTSGGKWTGHARFVPEMLDKPLRWRKPRRVFVNSMSDLFHDDITDEQIAAVFGVMAACPWHIFQVLTKRPARMLEWFRWLEVSAVKAGEMFPADDPGWRRGYVLSAAAIRAGVPSERHPQDGRGVGPSNSDRWPIPNVHLGVSCEDQRAANERIPLLLRTPAAVRWVSLEPLIGPIEVGDPIVRWGMAEIDAGRYLGSDGKYRTPSIDWVVVGSESGRNARPMDLDWVRQIRDDCVEAEVPLFFKQRHENGAKISMPELDGRVWDQYPEIPNA